MLRNLLSSSPLFKPFDQKQQMDLLNRFEGHEVQPGTVLIREGEAGKGLFVILLGEVEVLKTDPNGVERPVARLGTGELFGEMALLGEPLTTATVRALAPTTILFLGRDYFRRLVDALPSFASTSRRSRSSGARREGARTRARFAKKGVAASGTIWD